MNGRPVKPLVSGWTALALHCTLGFALWAVLLFAGSLALEVLR